MGASKTICFCAGGKCKSIAASKGDRDQLRQNLEEYLDEQVCVPGVTEEDLVIDPYVEAIAHTSVRAALGCAASFSGVNAAGALKCQSILARSAGLILNHAHELAAGNAARAADRLVPIELTNWSSREDRPDATPELGSLLERSLARACAELAAAARLDDTQSMQHHAALVVDLVSHVLTLSTSDEKSSENLLDPAHGHHQAVTDA